MLLGSSGVGKSTLVNRLAGRDAQATRELRRDGKGRHTTSRRELMILPSGGLVIDTPGISELQLWNASLGVRRTLRRAGGGGRRLPLPDCRHSGEPGCAVAVALEAGELSPERLAAQRKLQREQRHLEVRAGGRAAMEERRRWTAIQKAARTRLKPGLEECNRTRSKAW